MTIQNEAALARAEREGLLGHELGDACLVWGERRPRVVDATPLVAHVHACARETRAVG